MKILFYDSACVHPYDPKTLKERGMGGTEATVIRIAEALSAFHDVTVAQRTRKDKTVEGARYVPLGEYEADVTVVLRNPLDCAKFKNRILWMHDYVDVELEQDEIEAVKGATIVAVSDWHKENLRKVFTEKVRKIYNPCDVKRRGIPKVPGKLLFCSSPHKGLDKTLDVMCEIVARDASHVLYVANPGYYESRLPTTKHLKPLGSLKHSELMKHLEESVCMLQANDVFPETFGIVYAEAKALGTPVLTYDVGAAKEVYGSAVPKDATTEQFAEQLLAGLETPSPDPRFDLTTITREWLELLATKPD